MASNIDHDPVPSRECVAQLLAYLDILYPGGKAIDPIKSLDENGYPFYKDEVYRFFALVGQHGILRHSSVAEGNAIYTNRDKIRNATWKDLGAMFYFCSVRQRFSQAGYEHAISSGIVQLALHRMKELSENR